MHKYIYAMAGFALVAAFSGSAHAQNNKPIRSGTFYEDRASGVVGGSVVLTFTQAPADKFLNITNVACSLVYGTTLTLLTTQLTVGTTSGADDIGREYVFGGGTTTTRANQGMTYATINADGILFKIGPGRYPSISAAFATPGGTGTCTIVGNLSDS